jgi:hypothetical protein
MRSRLLARLAVAAMLAATAATLGGCDALTPPICVRHSDCPTSQICNAAGKCEVAPDASTADAAGDGGATTADAAVDAAAVQTGQP